MCRNSEKCKAGSWLGVRRASANLNGDQGFKNATQNSLRLLWAEKKLVRSIISQAAVCCSDAYILRLAAVQFESFFMPQLRVLLPACHAPAILFVTLPAGIQLDTKLSSMVSGSSQACQKLQKPRAGGALHFAEYTWTTSDCIWKRSR